ncbi:MAG: thioesterase family protein [Candidatus Heimdallarchaeota archaeon]|nr:MAG: thioesterase family protein [Candidatus Heimdallarchaeota archaeon]
MEYKFDRDVHVERTGENRFETEISSDWNIVAPNGGYLMAIAGKVISSVSDYQIPLSMTAYYHKPTSPGHAELIIDRIIKSKRTITTKISLIQKNKVVISYTGMFTQKDAFSGMTLVQKQPLLPDPSVCVEIPDSPLSFFKQVRLSVPNDQLDWLQGVEGKDTVFSGYFSFQDNRPMDALSVMLFVDATPPPILRKIGPLVWVPTIELTVQVRNIPTGSSLGFVSNTRFTTNGLTETDIELWSEKGKIIALGRQLAFIKEDI